MWFKCVYMFNKALCINSVFLYKVCLVQSLSHVKLFPIHELQHARFLCPSPSPRICSQMCPLSQWCHPTISSMNWLFPLDSQSTGASASASSPSNEYSELISFTIDWLDLLTVQGALQSLLQYHNSKHQFFGAQPSLWSNSHIYT